MNTQKEYIIIANGRPYFSVSCLKNLSAVVDEAKRRFGADAKIEVFLQTTEPYAPAEGDSK
jgi:UDP-N-acetylglucosamine pyrophosphorylase